MEAVTYVTPRQYSIIKLVLELKEPLLVEISERLGVRQEDLMRDLSELEAKKLVEVVRAKRRHYVLAELAKYYLERGFPEEVVHDALATCTSRVVEEFAKCVENIAKYPIEEVYIGIQYLARSRCIVIDKGVIVAVNEDRCVEALKSAKSYRELLNNVSRGMELDADTFNSLKRRRLVEVQERVVITLRPTNTLVSLWERGLVKEKILVTVVKPEYAPELDRYLIKEFDLSVEPPKPRLSKKHPFMQFIDELREIMVSMGFEEVKGPHVESELWNFDVLYQAQDHPAREIHDTFFIKTSLQARAPLDLIERTQIVHETGWGYKWSPERALKLVLRSQTTAVTARAIYERGPGEYRVFTIDRNFRPESLDAKHSMEFYQLDGVIVGKNVSFKHLLYFFKELAAALGIREVWFKPGYFPFTEPSVEGYIKHPKLGWIEVFPGGMFRPEVMEILGASTCKAAAWGIGVDRLAMTVLEVDDIRLLFSRNLEVLSSMRFKGLDYFTKKSTGKSVKVVDAPL
ncbi:MAG: phenylalanine--tRNA ligase subunit alpha [Desulfurococcaceae archaeon]